MLGWKRSPSWLHRALLAWWSSHLLLLQSLRAGPSGRLYQCLGSDEQATPFPEGFSARTLCFVRRQHSLKKSQVSCCNSPLISKRKTVITWWVLRNGGGTVDKPRLEIRHRTRRLDRDEDRRGIFLTNLVCILKVYWLLSKPHIFRNIVIKYLKVQ